MSLYDSRHSTEKHHPSPIYDNQKRKTAPALTEAVQKKCDLTNYWGSFFGVSFSLVFR